jgi:hypothetical protein
MPLTWVFLDLNGSIAALFSALLGTGRCRARASLRGSKLLARERDPRDSDRPAGGWTRPAISLRARRTRLCWPFTAERDSVLSIVAGLDEGAWHRSVVPSGWTPAGLVEHLGGAEWHWFQGVVAAQIPAAAWG